MENTHTFTLVLSAGQRVDGIDGLAESLFEAGCDDALFGTTDGVLHLDFDREAGSLVEAIASAIEHVESTGARVVCVEPSDLTVQFAVATIRVFAAFNGGLTARDLNDPVLTKAILRLVTP